VKYLKENLISLPKILVIFIAGTAFYVQSSDDLQGFKEFKQKKIQKIIKTLDESDVEILTHKKPYVRVDYSFKEKVGKHIIKVDGNELNIRNKKEEGGEVCSYKIFVPEKNKLSNITANIGSGCVIFNGITFDNSKISLGKGSAFAKNIKANETVFSLGKGSIFAENLQVNKSKFSIGKGDISLLNVMGDVKANSGSGNISFILKKLIEKKQRTLNANTGSGKIIVKLPENTSIFYKGLCSGLQNRLKEKANYILKLSSGYFGKVFVSKL
jgi:hypothetical protein